jgi:hypothetical protein
MSTSGALDEAEEVTQQFIDHFQKVTAGSGSGPKWVARFCKAYVAHGMVPSLRHHFTLLITTLCSPDGPPREPVSQRTRKKRDAPG